jgi:hypothetical protein
MYETLHLTFKSVSLILKQAQCFVSLRKLLMIRAHGTLYYAGST